MRHWSITRQTQKDGCQSSEARPPISPHIFISIVSSHPWVRSRRCGAACQPDPTGRNKWGYQRRGWGISKTQFRVLFAWQIRWKAQVSLLYSSRMEWLLCHLSLESTKKHWLYDIIVSIRIIFHLHVMIVYCLIVLVNSSSLCHLVHVGLPPGKGNLQGYPSTWIVVHFRHLRDIPIYCNTVCIYI